MSSVIPDIDQVLERDHLPRGTFCDPSSSLMQRINKPLLMFMTDRLCGIKSA